MSIFDSGEEPEENDEEEDDVIDVDESVASEDSVEELEDDLTSLNSEIGDLSERVNELGNNQDVQDSDIDELKDEVDRLREDMNELLGMYDLVASRINPLVEQDIDALVPELNTDINRDVEDFYELKDMNSEHDDSNQNVPEFDGLKDDIKEELKKDVRQNLFEDIQDEIAEEFDGHTVKDSGDEQMSDQGVETQDEDSSLEHREDAVVSKIHNNVSQEVVAMEWMNRIVDEYSVNMAVNMLNHYDNLGWISSNTRRQLSRRLQMGNFEVTDSQEDKIPSEIHEISSKYINQLAR